VTLGGKQITPVLLIRRDGPSTDVFYRFPATREQPDEDLAAAC
jgi:hypothetical protein